MSIVKRIYDAFILFSCFVIVMIFQWFGILNCSEKYLSKEN